MTFHPPQSHLQQRDRQFLKGARLMRRSHLFNGLAEVPTLTVLSGLALLPINLPNGRGDRLRKSLGF
jgi:hypothetical protein